MVGLKIGLAIAMPEIVVTMNKMKFHYHINILARIMALIKLDEETNVLLEMDLDDGCISEIPRWRHHRTLRW